VVSAVENDLASRASLQLGGGADRRFERRLTVVRRVARYFLVADVLAGVFAITYHNPSASIPVPTFYVLGYALPILVLFSLVRVVTLRVSREVTVDADPERVFALLVDPDAWVRLGGTWLGRYRRINAVSTVASGGTKGRATLAKRTAA